MSGARRGPKTGAGKRAVKMNAVRHGVLSMSPVVDGEDEGEWEELRRGVNASFDTVGTVEGALGDIIAMLFWRRCRAVRMETAAITHYLNDVPRDYRRKRLAEGESVDVLTEEAMEEMDRMLSARLLPGSGTIDKVLRYETSLHRFMCQTIHQLMIIQQVRYSRGYTGGPEIQNPLKAKFPDDGAYFPSTMRIGGSGGSGPRALRQKEGLLRPPKASKAAHNGREEEGLEHDEEAKGQAERRAGAPQGVLREGAARRPRLNRAERRRRERSRTRSRPNGGG